MTEKLRVQSRNPVVVWVNSGLLILSALVVSILYSGFDKPIWIDEYLHFAFGGLSFTEALDVLRSTTGSGVNWGKPEPIVFLTIFFSIYLAPIHLL